MTAAAPLARRAGGTLARVARSPLTLWVCFVLAHLWLGLLNLVGPGNPLGDVTLVYRFWVDEALVNDFWVGIDSRWVYPIVAFVPMLLARIAGALLYAGTWLTMVMLLNVVAFGVLTAWGRRRQNTAIG